ncbi:flagellar brake protein [Desulfitobacterium metallireducens]|uniref:Pilus assembly protein PilZ n=1 Tax=Desulfitobacterium metallireducens DSM 15288 TaxID=871968 RepID=W0EFD4_9FIRM|nr:flagellar brake domain-containing protein [Desulfitobacterium metallireducens]AHF07771.1 pilus assembly protein PilZ [Desulfitobacterium metallireducens DSM 15288]
MDYRKKLVPGLAVDLMISEGELAGQYKTHLDEVGEKIISVFAPMVQGQLVPLREGTPLKVIFWDEVAAYEINTTIMQRIAVPVAIFILEYSNDIRRVQRRNYVRIPATYLVTFRAVTRQGLSDTQKGTMLDLSGGGMRFQTNEPVEKGAILIATLDLPTGPIQISARVCRMEKEVESKKYSISVDFYQIPERDRDRIIRCVFDLQRDMRKKGLV